MKNIIFIPARYSSSRLPGKVLMELEGKSIIQHCYENALKSELKDSIFILVDNDKVYEHCLTFTKNVIMTSSQHESGTSRISEVSSKNKFSQTDNIINLQGDEPFISPKLIDKMFLSLLEGNNIVSCYHNIDENTAKSINNVKVVLDKNNNALYFSRSLIPFIRDKEEDKMYSYNQHIGLYGYKKEFVNKIAKLSISAIEKKEKLEQLTFLYEGYNINMIFTEEAPIGIDTKEDYDYALMRIKKLREENE